MKKIGPSIEKFRKLKKLTVATLAEKTKITDVADICKGKREPTKEEIKNICKTLEMPASVIALYSLEDKDVTPRKREAFALLAPAIKNLIESLVVEEKKPIKKKK